MGLFQSKPKNRKRRFRRRRKPEATWCVDSPSAAPKRRRKSQKENEVYELHAKIGALESFLAKKQEAEVVKLQMKADNILPPPDRSQYRRQIDAMTMAEKRRYNAERSRNGMRFLFLFCVACALCWWIIFSSV